MKAVFVIFGITGDLATRKLLPALDSIVSDASEGRELSIIGVSRRDVQVDELLRHHPILKSRSSVFTMNLGELGEYQRLKKHLEAIEADKVLFYLSVPPGAATGIVDYLGEVGLTDARYQVLFEKPFGYDLVSAQDFIERTAQYFKEEQLYRIDHYMAKEIAAEIVKLRRNAENRQYHWSRESVKSVSVIAAESIGIEGRGQFYEQTGALRDFIQGHLMQLLSLVLIDEPGKHPLPKERYEALKSLALADPSKVVRGQYEGYQQEAENPGSTVETFVALELASTHPRWRGVPLHLITGKALNTKASLVRIEYSDGTVDEFEEGKVRPAEHRTLDAYERVLLDAMLGNDDIFTTSEEVLRSWEVVAPIQTAWSMSDAVPPLYAPGSSVDEVLSGQ